MYVAEKHIHLFDFPVNKDFGEEEDFFRLITKSGEVQLRKLPFQKKQPLPDTLNCRIKGYNDGIPVISHNMPRYVSEFYADGFSLGQDFEFRVIGKPAPGAQYYRLEDENGLQFKLHDTSTPFTMGQTVKCKFESLDQAVYILRHSDAESRLNMIRLRDVCRILKISPQGSMQLEHGLRRTAFMNKAMEEHDRGYASWIFTALRALKENLHKWFVESVGVNRMPLDTLRLVLTGARRFTLFLLEESGFLRNLKGSERTDLQSELTDIIDYVDIYIEALDIISKRGQKIFIDRLLQHLKESGYVYKPNRRFAVMMVLFKVSPELVISSLSGIFDALMGWDIDTWRTEPFRHAFVEQLQLFISETRDDIDRFLIPETPADNEMIEKVLTAIAIQQSLAKGSDHIDMSQNLSFFYRCLAMLRHTKAASLLNKSLLSLRGVKLPTDFTWNDIKETTMMMTRAAVDAPANAKLPNESKFYVTDRAELEINGAEITITRDPDAPNQVPNGLFPWPALQVRTALDHTFSRAKFKTLEGHAEYWNDVEASLFEPRDTVETRTEFKATLDIGDEVRIIVDRVIPSSFDPNKIEAFHCSVIDDHYEGNGIMKASELVTYNLHGITVGTFRNDKGEPMQFNAVVKNIDANDNLEFSLLESVQMATRDITWSGDQCRVVITKDNGVGRDYSAISEKGFGLFVKKNQRDERPYHPGNVLMVQIVRLDNNNVYGEAIDGPLDGQTLTNAMMLKSVLQAICVNPDDSVTDIDLDDYELLDPAEIREIINILRFKAVTDCLDLIQSFDYLSYARILARLISDPELMSMTKAHKDMLLLHQYYAKNKHLFIEDIERVRAEAPHCLLIQRLADKLSIVASLAHPEQNQMLWDLANNSTVESQKSLAQMALSHNLLWDVNHDDPAASAIKEQIAKTLNVNTERRNLKYYGSENQYVEFKSSIVYPAQKGKSGISMADPDKQEYEILHIIAGFLNTTGGTLYIGVSDDHFERGLDEDFKFYKLDQSERNNTHRRRIKSLDNMANYLQNLIDGSFNLGTNAGEYAKVYIDEESTKGVLMVKVNPCLRVVTFDDKIFVRHSAKTVPLTKDSEIDQFRKDREIIFNQQIQAELKARQKAREASQPTAGAKAEPATSADEQPADDAFAPETANATLTTSKIRRNVLHEYIDPEHFATPKFYIRFVGDDEYIVTTDEWSLDSESDRLDLAVLDDETDHYLLLIYEGEGAVKVPFREIMEKKMNVTHSHSKSKKLVFAAPARKGQGVYSLHANARGTIYERFTPIDEIPLGSMGSTAPRMFEADCNTLLWDIVPASRAQEFDDISSVSLKRYQLGSLARGSVAGKVAANDVIQIFYSKFKQ